jgi:hypothetical protein
MRLVIALFAAAFIVLIAAVIYTAPPATNEAEEKDSSMAPADREAASLRGIFAAGLNRKLPLSGLDLNVIAVGDKNAVLWVHGPAMTRPLAYQMAARRDIRKASEDLGFTAIKFSGDNMESISFALDPRKIPSREYAFDSLVWTKEGDLPNTHRIIEDAKPSLAPGDYEFLSNYLKILDAGHFGEALPCRAEGMMRFHNDPTVMRTFGVKPGTCAKRAAQQMNKPLANRKNPS